MDAETRRVEEGVTGIVCRLGNMEAQPAQIGTNMNSAKPTPQPHEKHCAFRSAQPASQSQDKHRVWQGHSSPKRTWQLVRKLLAQKNKTPLAGRHVGSGGDEKIRTSDTLLEYAPLAGECLRPLGHVSEPDAIILASRVRVKRKRLIDRGRKPCAVRAQPVPDIFRQQRRKS